MTYKVAILDDHKIVRDGLKAIILGSENLQVCLEAGRAKDLLDNIEEAQPDVLLLDLNLPDMNGNEIIEELLKKLPVLRIMVLSSEYNKELINDAIKRGASGYLNKDTSADELLNAIDLLLKGEPYFGRNLSHIIYSSYKEQLLHPNADEDKKMASEREIEIIEYLSKGLSTKEIAEIMCISARTVESHKKNLMEKFDVKNTLELVCFAIKKNIIQL